MTEWDARGYSRISAMQSWLADKSLATLVLRGDERVLDVGCGDGKITAKIAQRVRRGRALGVDASEKMIGFAAVAFPAAAHPNLQFRVADAARLPFVAAFDLVVSFNCLHWVRDQAVALSGIAAALVPSGRTHLRMVARGARPSLEACIEETRRAPAWAEDFANFETPFAHYTPAEYGALAGRCGLRVERLDVQQERWDFGSREAFMEFAEATFVEWTQRLPPERQRRFIGDVLDRYAGTSNVFTFYQMELVSTPA